MFLAVWLIYAADRLLDARLLDARLSDARLDARSSNRTASLHHFHHRHRLAFTLASALATTGIVLLLPAIPVALLGPYLLLAALLSLWLLLIHFTRLPLPKTLAPGIFFAAAVFIPALDAQPLTALLLPFASFVALCTLNCLLIQFWKRHPQPTPTLGLHAFSCLLLAAPVLFPSPVAVPVSLAAAALRFLSTRRTSLHPTTLRAAADLALLTPLLLLPLLA